VPYNERTRLLVVEKQLIKAAAEDALAKSIKEGWAHLLVQKTATHVNECQPSFRSLSKIKPGTTK
jgi:hypothetical protein